MAVKPLFQLPPQFDYQIILQHLSNYKKPRDKLRQLIKAGEIVRIKKGLYVLGPIYNRPFSAIVIANLMYGPSYVSSLSALAFWRLIPERVTEVLSATPKRNKSFQTPIGNFNYFVVPLAAYPTGLSLEQVGDGQSAFIAKPEKALSDYVATEHNKIRSTRDMMSVLTGLRIPLESLRTFNIELLADISKGYKRGVLKILLRTFEEMI